MALRAIGPNGATFDYTPGRPPLPRIQSHHEFYMVSDKNERIATAEIRFNRGGLWLVSVWTRSEHRKKGYARAMIEQVLELYGDRDIYLTVAPYENTPVSEDQLVVFYASFGFRRTDVPDVMKRNKGGA